MRPDPCCPALGDAPLDREAAEALAAQLKAVADPVRLQLLSIIRCAPDRESCVCDLPAQVGLTQPTVSHHLKVLTQAGLLTRERRGQWVWYRLAPENLARLAAALA